MGQSPLALTVTASDDFGTEELAQFHLQSSTLVIIVQKEFLKYWQKSEGELACKFVAADVPCPHVYYGNVLI